MLKLLCFRILREVFFFPLFLLVHDCRVSSQGSPLGAEQVPSPQSPLNPRAGMGKNEASQVIVHDIALLMVHY